MVLPAAHGRFPVAMVYDGYAAGTNPVGENGNQLGQELLARGFALFGVNVPGTGCSGGKWNPVFRRAWAQDGAYMVNWAAAQPWSTGKVGMFGTSFPGFMAMYVAGEHPRGLAAVVSAAWTGNFRDAVFQGGMTNLEFPNIFDVDVFADGASDPVIGLLRLDLLCEINYAEHELGQLPDDTGLELMSHPYVDDFWSNQVSEIASGLPGVKVPVLTENAYQDGIASGAGMDYYSMLHPKTSWFVLTNGVHTLATFSQDYTAQEFSFLEQFVAGRSEGWKRRPHVQIWHDTYVKAGGSPTPKWVTTYPLWPPRSTLHTLHLRTGGILSRHLPTGSERSDSYLYPLPAGSTTSPQELEPGAPDPNLWALPVLPGGNAAYTTPPLTSNLDVLGASSLNVWLSSTAPNTDVQVTVSEVRPDGKEQYVDRGWLRLSERKLSAASTATWPQPTYLKSDVKPLVPGVPTYARIPIYPFEHLFRKGSSIRISIEAPLSSTGLAGLALNLTPAVVRVWHDPSHESEWVFRTITPPANPPPLAECGTVLSEDCRTNTEAVPRFDAPGPPAPDWRAARPSCAPAAGRVHGDHLGPVYLDASRARARRSVARHASRGHADVDFFCARRGAGIQVAYPTRRLLRTLRAAARRKTAGRVVVALTANRRYSFRHLKPRAPLTEPQQRGLRNVKRFQIGHNAWYLFGSGTDRGILKVRHGKILEIGIANRGVTQTRDADRILLSALS